MHSIVVFAQNRDFFGAQIVHIPLLRYVRSCYPDANLYLFAKYRISCILETLGVVERVILEKNRLHTIREYRALGADLTLNLRKQSTFISLLMLGLNRNRKIGFENMLSKLFFTAVKKHNRGIYRAENYLTLMDSKLSHKQKDRRLRITILPGAGGEHKIWAIEKYIYVAQALVRSFPDYEVCFVLGEKEQVYKKLLGDFTVYDQLCVSQLFAHIEDSMLVLANDCGPSHIAHISGVKILTLFTNQDYNADATIAEWFYKNGFNRYILGEAGKSINSISEEGVLKNVKEMLKEV